MCALLIAGACGAGVARATRAKPLWAAATVYGHLCIFLSILALQLLGLRITFLNCSLILSGIGIASFLFSRRPKAVSPIESQPDSASPAVGWHRMIVFAVLVMGLAMAHVALFSPLQGWDTSWRWDLLARRIASLHSLSFYPPRSGPDYELYGYPDGFPPLVSSVYAYLYLGAGRAVPAMTGVVVTLQWAATLLLAARAANTLRPGAGQWTALAMASCGLVFWGTGIGQETGLTALAAAATFAAALSPSSTRLALALPLATLALCREYGPGLAAAGGGMMLIIRTDRLRVAQVIAVAVALSLPWSIRNVLLTGNPLWSHSFLGLPVNDVHVRIMAFYHSIFTPTRWSGEQWQSNTIKLIRRGGGPLLLLIPAGLLLARQFPRLVAATALFIATVTALWIASIGYTSGGAGYSLRVLTPAAVAAAILVGLWLANPNLGQRTRKITTAALCLGLLFAGLEAARMIVKPVAKVTGGFLRPVDAPYDRLNDDRTLARFLRPGQRVLTDSMDIQSVLTQSGFSVVPLWSPEVAFLHDPSLSPEELTARLAQLKITHVMMQHITDPTAYNLKALSDLPFIRYLNTGATGLRPADNVESTFVWVLPQPQ